MRKYPERRLCGTLGECQSIRTFIWKPPFNLEVELDPKVGKGGAAWGFQCPQPLQLSSPCECLARPTMRQAPTPPSPYYLLHLQETQTKHKEGKDTMGKTLRNICLLESLAASRVFCEGHNDADISTSSRPQASITASEGSNELVLLPLS